MIPDEWGLLKLLHPSHSVTRGPCLSDDTSLFYVNSFMWLFTLSNHFNRKIRLTTNCVTFNLVFYTHKMLLLRSGYFFGSQDATNHMFVSEEPQCLVNSHMAPPSLPKFVQLSARRPWFSSRPFVFHDKFQCVIVIQRLFNHYTI